MATVSEMRAPCTKRESMSRPRRSVPNQCSKLGGARRASMSMSVGLGSGRRSAAPAAMTIKPIQASASQNSQPTAGTPAHASATRARSVLGAAISLRRMTDPGIEDGVEHVDQEIDDHEARSHEQHDALQDHKIARVDRGEQEPADARQGKHGFHDHG